jgi:hypothetical protein
MKTKRWKAVLVAGALIAGVIGVAAQAAQAATTLTVVSVTPNSNLINGNTLAVVVKADETRAGAAIAVTQCGNAAADGTPFSAAPTPDDCMGNDDAAGGFVNLVSELGTGFGALNGGVTADKEYSVSIIAARTGIGVNDAQCIQYSGPMVPCTVIATIIVGVTPDSTATPGSFSISYKPPAEASVKDVVGQNGTEAARRGVAAVAPDGELPGSPAVEGDKITLQGSDWDASGTITARLCKASDPTDCDDSDALTGTLSSDADGDLDETDELTVTDKATSGARVIKLSDSDETVLVPIQILGTRAVTISPTVGGLGTKVTATGSNFDATQAVVLVELDVTFAAISAPKGALSTATGDVSGFVNISSADTKYIAVAETDAPTTQFAVAAFTFSANECAGTNCELVQTVSMEVDGDVLTSSQTSNAIAMDEITLDGEEQTSEGDLNDITILDARGTLLGWSVTATMSNIAIAGSSASNSSISAADMTLTPTCAPKTVTSGSTAGITGGTAGALDPTTGRALCAAGSGDGGGTYKITGTLSLKVPATLRSGSYTATLTVLIV